MEKAPISNIITDRGKRYIVLQTGGGGSERYPFEEWEKQEAKLRELRNAAANPRLSPTDEAQIKKSGL